MWGCVLKSAFQLRLFRRRDGRPRLRGGLQLGIEAGELFDGLRRNLREDRVRLRHRGAGHDRLGSPRMHGFAQLVVARDDRVREARLVEILNLFQMRQRRRRRFRRGLHTFCAECGRNGASRWLASDTAWAAVCSTVPRRAGLSLIFHGSVAEMYLLMSPTTRIASDSAFFWRWFSMSPPTVSNAALVSASSARSSSVAEASSNAGISPKFLLMRLATRFTRLPPGCGELLIVVAHELGPSEVGIGAFRSGHGDVVTHGVHGVTGEDAARSGSGT